MTYFSEYWGCTVFYYKRLDKRKTKRVTSGTKMALTWYVWNIWMNKHRL